LVPGAGVEVLAVFVMLKPPTASASGTKEMLGATDPSRICALSANNPKRAEVRFRNEVENVSIKEEKKRIETKIRARVRQSLASWQEY
jgi:hypothetical protein